MFHNSMLYDFSYTMHEVEAILFGCYASLFLVRWCYASKLDVGAMLKHISQKLKALELLS